MRADIVFGYTKKYQEHLYISYRLMKRLQNCEAYITRKGVAIDLKDQGVFNGIVFVINPTIEGKNNSAILRCGGNTVGRKNYYGATALSYKPATYNSSYYYRLLQGVAIDIAYILRFHILDTLKLAPPVPIEILNNNKYDFIIGV